MISKNDKRLYWIIFGVVSLLIRYFLKGHSEIVETYYSRGFFQFVRFVSDWAIGWLPLPGLYLLIILVLPLLIWRLVTFVKKIDGFLTRVLQIVISLLATVCGVIGIFLWFWGFNYLRIPIEDQMSIQPRPLSTNELKEELNLFTIDIIAAREAIPFVDNNAFTKENLPDNLIEEIQNSVSDRMSSIGYPTSRNLPVRTLLRGTLLRIGTAGFYLPFTGECNIDNGLHALQKPHVLAHEMAHGQGIGDEGSCNFIALLSCINSENAFIRYSGLLAFYRTLAVNYRRQRPEEYKLFRSNLPKGIIADLDAINANSRSYPDIFPKLRDQTYDAFLKTQGIKEGMKNYNRVIVLERAYRLKIKTID
ncbi:MAG: DUF3810 domain-containing protein [Saprospiraceae bacterium]